MILFPAILHTENRSTKGQLGTENSECVKLHLSLNSNAEWTKIADEFSNSEHFFKKASAFEGMFREQSVKMLRSLAEIDRSFF